MNKIFVCLVVLFMFSLLGFKASAIISYISSPSPSNEETDVSFASNVTTCIVVDKLGGCTLNISFTENNSGSWVEYQNYTNVSGGQSYCGNFSVVCGTSYYWRVSSFIDCGQTSWWENHTYSFTTSDCPVSHVSPSNNSVDNCPCCLALCAKMSNLSGDTIKFAFQSNYSGSWVNLEDDRVVAANSTYCICVPEFVWFNYTYYWRVIYYDEGAESSDIFCFTTAEDVEDCPCGESGNAGSVEVFDGYSMLGLVGIVGLLGLLFVRVKRRYD